MESKCYEIGGRRFYQQALSCGQAEHVVPLIEGLTEVETPKGDLGPTLHQLGAKLYRFLALILIPEGETRGAAVRRADTPGGTKALEDFFREELEPAQIEEVVRDFLAYGPLTTVMRLMTHLFTLPAGAGQTAAPTSTPSTPSPPAGQA